MKRPFFDIEKSLERLEILISRLYTRSVCKKLKRAGSQISLRYPSTVVGHQYITIGHRFSALRGMRLEAVDTYRGQTFRPEIVIGDDVKFHDYVHIGCVNRVQIGNCILFAGKIYVSDHLHGVFDERYNVLINHIDQPLSSEKTIVIEDNCWIGEGVAILPDTRIGHGAIVGANSVVTHDVSPLTMVAGAPAKPIKSYDATSGMWEAIE